VIRAVISDSGGVGMTAVVYRDAEQAMAEIRAALSAP
jgi:hypothetical protein